MMIDCMGARANFVLVDDAGWRLYYSHWAANEMCSALIAGPQAATRYITAQMEVPEREGQWLGDEGGAVVDHRERRLIFYGDMNLTLELATKRVFMQLLASTWPGWNIDWAYDAIGDLAAHVGMDWEAVDGWIDDEERDMPEWLVDAETDWGCHLLTVVDSTGQLTAYPFMQSQCHTAWQGPGLLERLSAEGSPRVRLPFIPTSGLHLDVRDRTGGAWLDYTSTGLVPALADLWPGWQMEFWQDRYEEQMRRCHGAVDCPPLDLMTGLDDLLASLTERIGHDPVPAMLNLALKDPPPGLTAQVNPLFTAHAPVDPAPAEWSGVLRAAAELRTRLQSRPS
jgi:hypothetical protein